MAADCRACVVLDSLDSFSTVLEDGFSAGGNHRGLIPRQQGVAYDCPPPPTPPPCLGISAFAKGSSLVSAIFHLLSLRWCEVVHSETCFPSSCQIQRSPWTCGLPRTKPSGNIYTWWLSNESFGFFPQWASLPACLAGGSLCELPSVASLFIHTCDWCHGLKSSKCQEQNWSPHELYSSR